jgi:hypothetical protein
MGKLAVETFYLGERPNCYRIYNKIVEQVEAASDANPARPLITELMRSTRCLFLTLLKKWVFLWSYQKQ